MRAFVSPALAAFCIAAVACTEGGRSAEPEVVQRRVELATEHRPVYERSCRHCHEVKDSGAPLTQDFDAWRPRAERGMDELLEHTIVGYGKMPPMGFCMECSQDQFVALIEYMSGVGCDDAEVKQ